MNWIKTVLLITSLLFISQFSLQAQQTLDGAITVDGVDRTYIIHFPTATVEESAGLPLVFNLHGYTSTAAQQEFYSGMNTTSDANNFIVCYPEGLGNAWNIGFAGGSTADDVGFISALIDEFSDLYQINTKRVYSCGMSNGGFMSYELACKIPEKIAAIASVTGSMVANIDCDLNSEGMPVLQIHGTEDQVVPYAGSTGFMPIDDVIEFWVEKNGCSITGTYVTPIANNDPDDGSTVNHLVHSACNNLKNVELFKVEGGEHTWPGSSFTILGVTNQDINGSEEIWKFFNRYTLDGASTSVNETSLSNDLMVSPNPVDRLLQINFANNLVILHNSNGIEVGRSTDTQTLDVSQLSSGIYILCIVTDTELFTEKIVVQH